MERVFPLYGVRFISINDDFDSAQLHGDTGGINVAFKYLAAEFYSRDLSTKYKSAKYVKMKRGEYQSVRCPYGYKKGGDGRMEPDKETASNVRLIFELALDGRTMSQITKELFERGIPTPGEYKVSNGMLGHDISRSGGVWTRSTVSRILTDERYAGTYIIGKRAVTEVGGHRAKLKDESEWFKIPGHHEAIISMEVFEQVQARLPKIKCVKKNINLYPLKGKVFCGCCKHAMSRSANKTHIFSCRHSQSNENAPCHGLKIPEAELESTLYEILSRQAQIILNLEDLSDVDMLEIQSAKQAEYAKQIAAYNDRKRVLYERLILQEIDTKEYLGLKADIDSELDRLNQVHSALAKQTAQMLMDNKTKQVRKKLAQKISDSRGLTQELADALVERVNIYPGNRIEVEWKIKDFCAEENLGWQQA